MPVNWKVPPDVRVVLVTTVPPALSPPRAAPPALPAAPPLPLLPLPLPDVPPGGADEATTGWEVGSWTVSTAPATFGPVTCPEMVAGSPPMEMSMPLAAWWEVSVSALADFGLMASGYHNCAKPAPA